MEFGEVYRDWVKYLKRTGLYVKYVNDYSIACYYKNRKINSIREGRFLRPIDMPSVRCKAETITSCKNNLFYLMGDCLSYYGLKTGVLSLLCELGGFDIKPSCRWDSIVEKFGREIGAVQPTRSRRPRPNDTPENDPNFWFSVYDTKEDDAKDNGKWYDFYYHSRPRKNAVWRRR